MYLNVYRPSVVRRVNGQAFGGLVDSVLSDFFAPQVEADGVVVAQARFDVLEKGAVYEAFIEMPGVAKEDIEIKIEGAKVSVSAQAKRETVNGDGERVIIAQRQATRYARTFELPLEIADERAEASYENGVLKLVLPKQEVAQAKRLTVK